MAVPHLESRVVPRLVSGGFFLGREVARAGQAFLMCGKRLAAFVTIVGFEIANQLGGIRYQRRNGFAVPRGIVVQAEVFEHGLRLV